ncbi:hypothetical protein WA026_016238 [Henosepilachna vigintioctopunctata]|uniref:Uncharacterized protein n=1 Tax=Henosepilachna vigintioctopunctata TaxID=420089 RepID=A0AAW1TPC7_9CUCU
MNCSQKLPTVSRRNFKRVIVVNGVTEWSCLPPFLCEFEELLTKTEEVLPLTENLSILNNYASEQGSTTQILPPLNTVSTSDPLNTSTSQSATLDYSFQYLPLNEDPKTPCKEVQESTTQNLEDTITIGSLIEPQRICSRNSDNMVIPSPFKRALFWQTPEQNSIGRSKEKVHSVVSSLDEEWVKSGGSANDISDEVTYKEERNEEESRIKQGDYVIVKLPVMAMIACDESEPLFKVNDWDISAISESQIIKVLDVPNMIITDDRIKYKFDSALEADV